MPCFRPLRGWWSVPDEKGARKFTYRRVKEAYNDVFQPLTVPCGRCVACLLDRAKAWGVRCVHEASMYEENCFITLTYNDEHLPSDGSISVDTWQKFMKRFRRRIEPTRIRVFGCGEYGEKNWRPHYHALVFGYDFPDKVKWRQNKLKQWICTSDLLEDIWGQGFCSVGEVSWQSAAYVARYVMKKRTGKDADEHYKGRLPEQIFPSRGGRIEKGLGARWIERYWRDVYPRDQVIIDGKKFMPPRFYDEFLRVIDPDMYELVKRGRKRDVTADDKDRRLIVREECQIRRAAQLVRPL